MNSSQIASYRLHNQHLIGGNLKSPAEVVRWFGAVQAQDYLGSLWAIGLRMKQATVKVVEQAIAERKIIRTWPMRRTLHLVAAEDARWMLELLTPRLMSRSRSLHRHLELDERVFGRCREIFVNALSGGRQLSRSELYDVLEQNRIATRNTRGLHILCHLAQEALICFGARVGKQPTFALLEEWVPAAKNKEREEALAELARRYFTSHGPATLQDFVWWSGLTVADSTAAIEMTKAHLIREVIDGNNYWLAASIRSRKSARPAAWLLPPYDEYTVAYKDRSAIQTRLLAKISKNSATGVLGPVVVVDGQVVGGWKRTQSRSSAIIDQSLFVPLSRQEKRAVIAAISEYGSFLEQPVELA